MTRVPFQLLVLLLLPLRSSRVRGQLPPILFIVLLPAALLVTNSTLPLTGNIIDVDQNAPPTTDVPVADVPVLSVPKETPPVFETTDLVFLPTSPESEIVEEQPVVDVLPDTSVEVEEPPAIDTIVIENPSPPEIVDDEPSPNTEEVARADVRASLLLPNAVERGSPFSVTITLENVGTADAVRIQPHLVLPKGFDAIDGSSCSRLAPGASCTYTVDVRTTIDAEAGPQDISVEVAYA